MVSYIKDGMESNMSGDPEEGCTTELLEYNINIGDRTQISKDRKGSWERLRLTAIGSNEK